MRRGTVSKTLDAHGHRFVSLYKFDETGSTAPSI